MNGSFADAASFLGLAEALTLALTLVVALGPESMLNGVSDSGVSIKVDEVMWCRPVEVARRVAMP